MRTDARREYEREYKRRLRADPVRRAEKNRVERERLNRDLEKRKQKNAAVRARWAANQEMRNRSNKRRVKQQAEQRADPQWREKFQEWQRNYFQRHCDNAEWRERRDNQRVKNYYGVSDPVLVEALALVRAAKRKLRAS